ncbi:D-alanine--D-alanine ligase [bioreactor metagenome]|uniref:D-alanine--D-alanine ligase n=1 Tax=bioreactor metagenome TaxID=1076179 RepID=A0A645B5B7_9ZZZZ
MPKKNVCVIFGGQSSEHEVSLISASFVMSNVDPAKYELIKLGITKDGKWYVFDGPIEEIKENRWQAGKIRRAFLSPDEQIAGLVVLNDDHTYDTVRIDCAFPVLHGRFGEDGTIQGLFELAGIPYAGCGVVSSAVTMDKVFSRTIFDAASIPQAAWSWCLKRDFEQNPEKVILDIENRFIYPMFIKPANAGSSVGITKAKSREDLKNALSTAFLHDKKAVIEEYINGREIEISVLGTHDLTISVCGEIIPAREFYDYEAKYADENSRLIIPAPLTDTEYQTIKQYAAAAFNAAECEGLSRVDFFIRHSDGKVFLNEINTIPGFTQISMYPKLLNATGIDSERIVNTLIELGLNKRI